MRDAIFYERHEDDEGYDEINIRVVPRWKESHLSGDEWRISAWVEFKRKGSVIWKRGFSSLATAVNALPWFFMVAGEIGGEDYNTDAMIATESKCAQPSCSNEATVHYRMKKMYSREGYEAEPTFDYRMKFCERHKTRGDCGLQDADSNYEKLTPTKKYPTESGNKKEGE